MEGDDMGAEGKGQRSTSDTNLGEGMLLAPPASLAVYSTY